MPLTEPSLLSRGTRVVSYPFDLIPGGATGSRGLWLLLDLLADPLFLLAEFGGEFGAEVVGFEDWADFDFGSAEGAAFEPFDGFVHGSHLP